eukprot:2214491-Rhodomonas_salina.1
MQSPTGPVVAASLDARHLPLNLVKKTIRVPCQRERRSSAGEPPQPFVDRNGPCDILSQKFQQVAIVKAWRVIPGTDQADVYNVTIVWEDDAIVDMHVSLLLEDPSHVHAAAERSFLVDVEYDVNDKRVVTIAVQHSECY